MANFWIKQHIAILDDPQWARLSDHLWRRRGEFSLLAGKHGLAGALPSVEDIAWKLRASEEAILADLQSLAQAGMVLEQEPGNWFVVDFQEQQVSESTERVKQYRDRSAGGGGRDVAPNVSGARNVSTDAPNVSDSRYPSGVANTTASVSCNADASVACNTSGFVACNADADVSCNASGFVACNENVTAVPSNSNSTSDSDSISDSDSDSESESESEGAGFKILRPAAGGEGARKPDEPPPKLPANPAEAMLHPDVRVYAAATGGRIPGLSQYQAVIDTVRFLRAREKLDEHALANYLAPYWLAWSNRKRLDGRPYDPGNLTWLVEWALNKTLPPAAASKTAGSNRPAISSVEQTRKMLDERDKLLKKAVPPPPEVLAKIHAFKKQLEPDNHADLEKVDEDQPPGRASPAPDR